MKVTVDFRFKSLTADKFSKLVESVDISPNEIAIFFEVIEDDKGVKTYKRKAQTVEVTLPEWVANLPALAVSTLADLVGAYIKDTYIENFQPVGSHTWEEVEVWAAETGGRKRLEFSDELLAVVAADFGAFITAAVGNKALGERMKEACAAKFSMAAFQRHLNQSDETIIKKVMARLVSWAENVAENQPEKSEEWAPVFAYLHGRLEKNLSKLDSLPANIADIL